MTHELGAQAQAMMKAMLEAEKTITGERGIGIKYAMQISMKAAQSVKDEGVPAESVNERLLEALKALLVMSDRGPKPRKFDEALSWSENDEKARRMALSAIAAAEKEQGK